MQDKFLNRMWCEGRVKAAGTSAPAHATALTTDHPGREKLFHCTKTAPRGKKS